MASTQEQAEKIILAFERATNVTLMRTVATTTPEHLHLMEENPRAVKFERDGHFLPRRMQSKVSKLLFQT